MDTVGDEAWKSVRLAWRQEPWLLAGVPVAAVVFGLWIGLTGAAVRFLADAIAGGLTVDPWTGLTDLVVVVLALFWVVGPAAAATLLVRDRITNVRGNLATGYRLRHPTFLFLPPVVVLLAGLGLLTQGGASSDLLVSVALALLVGGAIWFLVRGVAYAYRVFAFSFPAVAHGVVLVTAHLVAVAALVLGAGAIGRGDLVETLADGLAGRTGVDALGTYPTGTTTLLDVPVPTPVAAVVVVPVALTAAYVAVQLVVSVVARLIKPTVRRPQLRTGQRYPAFARPTTSATPSARDPTSAEATASDAGTDGASGAEPDADGPTETDDVPADEGETPEAGEDDESDVVTNVSHTRVYTPPDDAEAFDPAAVADRSSGQQCDACGAVVDEAAGDGTCPACGADL